MFKLYVHGYFACMYVYVTHTSLVPMEATESIDGLKIELQTK